jgi:hypothetical protein
MDWQPIDTAPTDGSIVLLFRPDAHGWGKVTPGRWDNQTFAKRPKPYWEMWFKIGGNTEGRAWPPTYWMPLPAPPGDEMTAAHKLDFGTVYRPAANGDDVEQVLYVLDRLCAAREGEAGAYNNVAVGKLKRLREAAWEILEGDE